MPGIKTVQHGDKFLSDGLHRRSGYVILYALRNLSEGEEKMDWLEQAALKSGRKNQVLFSRDSAALEELSMLMQGQPRRVMVLWALEQAERIAGGLILRYPQEQRPMQAVQLSTLWSQGKVKMPQAQRAILQAHAVAKGLSDPADIALCHALGQGCATVHTAGHAIGLPMYELTALVRRYGLDGCRAPVERMTAQYVERLLYWQEHWQEEQREWAAFLCR